MRKLLLFILAALLLTACGSSDSDDSDSKESQSDPTTPATQTEREVTDGSIDEVETTAPPVGDCSAADLDLDLPVQPELPIPVAQTRDQIFAAAIRCDFDQLGDLASANPDFSFTFGAGSDPAAHWRDNDADEQTLATLARVLTTMPVERNQQPRAWIWPAAFNEDPTEEQWEELVDAGVYTETQIDQFRKNGSYLGYRIGIHPDGTWSFFIAGD